MPFCNSLSLAVESDSNVRAFLDILFSHVLGFWNEALSPQTEVRSVDIISDLWDMSTSEDTEFAVSSLSRRGLIKSGGALHVDGCKENRVRLATPSLDRLEDEITNAEGRGFGVEFCELLWSRELDVDAPVGLVIFPRSDVCLTEFLVENNIH